ncbi:MAG TPA: prepilin-type N-terminal cleavage/methylation domain-containing protein [Solirubrobacteraceae bacterium]|nr:prepilin-type N-terminal cleavage/methylation domain-containing protein [Solirubrobacteraceae bacterium]
MLVTFRTIFQKASARLREQGGFTLIEMTIASALGLLVTTATFSALETGQRTQLRDQEWALVVQEGRTGLARMTSEMRTAYSIRNDSSYSIDFYAAIGGKDYEINYNCEEKQTGTEFKQCVRKSAEVGSALPSKGQVIVKDVLNGTSADQPNGKEDPIFVEYTPSSVAPDLVTIKAVLPSSGTLKLAGAKTHQHQIVLENGAYIRNTAIGT